MKTMLSIVEFAAQRRTDQDDMEKTLYPIVSEAMQTYPATNWYADLLAEVAKLYVDTYHREGGTGRPKGVEKFLSDVRDTLEKTEDPTDATADRVSTWLATAILNAATMEATGDDEEFLVMEWVTMHDDDVRAAHVDTAGQQRPPGEPFDVAGSEMRYPGDPTAPIALWINCRCTLAPVLGTEAARGGTVTTTTTTSNSYTVNPGYTLTAAEAEPEAVSRPDGPIPWYGVLAPEGVWSGDKRQFLPNSLEFRDLPLPLTWQKESDDGHKKSITVASIDSIERQGNLMFATGYFMDTPEADEAIGLIAHFGRYGVSVDADDAEFEFDEDAGSMSFSRARISGASIVGIPAFSEAFVALGDGPPAEVTDVCDPESENYDEDACAESQAAALRDVSTDERKKDAKEGRAMPDGSYPIDNCSDLKNAIQAIGRAKDPGKVKAHIRRRKSSLGCPDVSIPDSWAVIDAMRTKVEAGRGPGWVTNPEDTRRLHDYWTKKGQPGYAKINWGVPGDFNRCRTLVGEKIAANSPEDMGYLNQICAQWHHDALGWWPGRPTGGEVEEMGGEAAPALTLTAGAGFCAPSEWFRNPELDQPTALTVTDDGRVFGHLAQWGVCHVGFDGVCVDPPRSSTDYAYFLTGEVTTDKGTIACGNITMDGPHAPLRLKARPAMAHYDNTCTVVADVTCGEDDHGIWVAGWIRPGVTDEQKYALRASGGLSGDWRMVNGHPKELIAALAVNSGGFPIPRVGIENGVQVALVAAGCVTCNDEPPTLEASTEDLAFMVAMHLRKIDARRERMKVLAARMGGTDDGL